MIQLSFKAILLLFSTIFILNSCVSSSKFSDLQAKYNFIEEEHTNMKNAQSQAAKLRSEKSELVSQIQDTEDLLKTLNAKYMGIRSSYEQLQADYDKLGAQNSNILDATATEKQEYENALSRKQDELDAKEKELNEKANSLNLKTFEIEQMNTALKMREEEIQTLSDDLKIQKNALESLKTRITSALANFTSDELTVEQKSNGQVYISLSQQLLFKKGSNQVDIKGQEAIKKLGKILKNTDVDIVVEGHTDTDGTSQKNWDLSVTRATEVVKILQSAGVKPENLVASGRAFYVPVANNDTEANKSINRRTEIILSPRLEKIFDLINKS